MNFEAWLLFHCQCTHPARVISIHMQCNAKSQKDGRIGCAVKNKINDGDDDGGGRGGRGGCLLFLLSFH